ncbi:hypothetical protein [Metaplanococcus flavidus]|uniref:Uncharacterized protein n=1 Tax=Metaplanococcus flavidus TaxID=569883 RepID=A0ABW3LAM7_9BACL
MEQNSEELDEACEDSSLRRSSAAMQEHGFWLAQREPPGKQAVLRNIDCKKLSFFVCLEINLPLSIEFDGILAI